MKRIVTAIASLLALVGCSTPTAPARDGADAARAAQARAALEAGSKSPVAARLSAN